MADVTTGATTESAAPAQANTTEELVSQAVEAADNSEPAPDETGEAKSEQTAKGPKKQTVGERISSYANRAKDAEARAQAMEARASELEQTMQARIDAIEQRLQAGQITPQQAQGQAETVKDAFETALEGMKFNEDLEPYRNDLIDMMKRVAEAAMKPLIQEREAMQFAEVQKERAGNWSKMVNKYADLFETDANAEGIRELKPEYNERAFELAQYADPRTAEGLDTIMKAIYYDVLQAERVKAQNQNVEKLKRSVVESSDSRTPAAAGSRSTEDMVREAMSAIK